MSNQLNLGNIHLIFCLRPRLNLQLYVLCPIIVSIGLICIYLIICDVIFILAWGISEMLGHLELIVGDFPCWSVFNGINVVVWYILDIVKIKAQFFSIFRPLLMA